MSKTTMKDDLVSMYTTVLQSVGITQRNEDDVDEAHLLNMTISTDGITIIPKIGDDELTLPTPDILRKPPEGVIFFHPLSESRLRGESSVIKFLKQAMDFNLVLFTTSLIQELAEIAGDSTKHGKLTAKQSQFLDLVPDLDKVGVDVVNKILAKAHCNLYNIYLKRDDELNGKNYYRIATCHSPILDELATKGTTVYGIDCKSNKRKKSIEGLFNYVIKTALSETQTDGSAYIAHGSNSDMAPYFHSLLSLYVNAMQSLNSIAYKYRKYVSDEVLNHYNNTIGATIDELQEYVSDPTLFNNYKGLIPTLPGNAGYNWNETGEETQEDEIKVKTELAGNKTVVSADYLLNRTKHLGNDVTDRSFNSNQSLDIRTADRNQPQRRQRQEVTRVTNQPQRRQVDYQDTGKVSVDYLLGGNSSVPVGRPSPRGTNRQRNRGFVI